MSLVKEEKEYMNEQVCLGGHIVYTPIITWLILYLSFDIKRSLEYTL